MIEDEVEPGKSETKFTDYEAMLQSTETSESKDADIDQLEVIPGFEGQPLHLDPIEEDSRYQALLASGQTGDSLRTSLRPLVEERLEQVRQLPAITQDQDYRLGGTKEYVPGHKEVINYGVCKIDTDRIVQTGTFENWGGDDSSGRHKRTPTGEVTNSPDYIVDLALDKLTGKFKKGWSDPIDARILVTRDNQYFYELNGGQHRVAAEKLLGHSQVDANVMAFESSFIDNPQAMRIHQKHLAAGSK